MPTPYDRSMEAALRHLRAALEVVGQQIVAYPGPISGCDAQFNQLLSDRASISQAIDALETTPFIPTPRSPEPGFALESR